MEVERLNTPVREVGRCGAAARTPVATIWARVVTPFCFATGTILLVTRVR